MFHQNKDLNIIPKVDLIVKGHDNCERLYNREVNMFTKRNDSSNSSSDGSVSSNQNKIRTLFNPNDTIYHSTKNIVTSPAKN